MSLEAHARQFTLRWVHEHSQNRETWKAWLKKCITAVAALVSFDSKGNLIFRKAMYTTYAILGLHRD